jgi:hypothetical protein
MGARAIVLIKSKRREDSESGEETYSLGEETFAWRAAVWLFCGELLLT